MSDSTTKDNFAKLFDEAEALSNESDSTPISDRLKDSIDRYQ